MVKYRFGTLNYILRPSQEVSKVSLQIVEETKACIQLLFLQTTANSCIILHPKSARIYFILVTALQILRGLVRHLVKNAKRYGRNLWPNNVSAFLSCKFITKWFKTGFVASLIMKVVVLQADTAEGALHKSTASLGLKMK